MFMAIESQLWIYRLFTDRQIRLVISVRHFIMRLGIFVPTVFRSYDRVQSAIWIRALQLVGGLRADGIDVSVNNPFRRYDVAIYHRGMRRNSVSFMRYLRQIAGRVYWDTCVDYFDRHEAATPEQVECARIIASLVDGICVPTEGIASSARRYCRNVFVMPDPIDTSHFESFKENINWAKPRLGWSGVACKAHFLNQYADFLDDRTLIISEKRPALPFRHEFTRWSYQSFPTTLLSCDVGFLPRALNSTYTINNSSFKALVFASLGIPIIADRLPSYEILAKDYPAVAFLDDYNYDPQKAFDALRAADRDPRRVRLSYDRSLWAQRLIGWMSDV